VCVRTLLLWYFPEMPGQCLIWRKPLYGMETNRPSPYRMPCYLLHVPVFIQQKWPASLWKRYCHYVVCNNTVTLVQPCARCRILRMLCTNSWIWKIISTNPWLESLPRATRQFTHPLILPPLHPLGQVEWLDDFTLVAAGQSLVMYLPSFTDKY